MDTRESHWGQNPYIRLLAESAGPDVELVGFTWGTLLMGKYDVFHVHWPEYLLRQPNSMRKLAARILTFAALLKLKARKIPIVRTMHNKTAHVGTAGLDAWMLRKLDSLVISRIWLAGRTDEDGIRANSDAVILHGDYTPWLEVSGATVTEPPGADRILCFGIMRRYKQFEEPAHAVEVAQRGHLTIAGSPADATYAAELEALARNSPEIITFIGRRLEDSELIALVQGSDLVVVPYRDLYNSGVILLALSLQRPVAVMDGDAARALAEEFGDYWIRIYHGPFDARNLVRVIEKRPAPAGSASSPLRDWSIVGRQHRDVYFAALSEERVPM
ncbi:glycosyltransferase [Pseudarthrobacter equi]|uniref:glycosyltransferase n=1 Tax=Pseudarthrobacter equi TaxID=728066 RepID=UPI0028D1C373|nr:glycosyltransferase [Pseudarthrobacter equi]